MAITNGTITTTINNHTQNLSSPPFEYNNGTMFSPMIIIITSIVLAIFLGFSFYAIISKHCLHRNTTLPSPSHQDSPTSSSGLDKSVVEKIMLCRYLANNNAQVMDSECSVCLTEFSDGESLRRLPNCGHAFHVLCIDTWLKLHANCPVCRASILITTSTNNEGETSLVIRNTSSDVVDLV